MTERVVYFLGAGFSRVFGLPLISDFLEKARDLHGADANPEHFTEVFDRIAKVYSRIKNTYHSDMRNIEEVLSLREMDVFLRKESSNPIRQFISDVIKAYTPLYAVDAGALYSEQRWKHEFLSTENNLGLLTLFVAAIQNVTLDAVQAKNGPLGPAVDPLQMRIASAPSPTAQKHYDIVTTNYDTLLESACTWLNKSTSPLKPLAFRLLPDDDSSLPALAKLHGCVSDGQIVPPTWNKTADEGIIPRWILAREILGRANHLRFIGYSLQEADAYVRYLLKSAATDSDRLKTITVICVDPSEKGEVQARYDRFIDFPPAKYKYSGNSYEHLLTNAAIGYRGNHTKPTPSESLEGAHSELWVGHQR